jgi:serine/threonine-protein kinase RsbW
MNTLIIKKLIVDDRNELFDADGMNYLEFPSDRSRIREYAMGILRECPTDFLEGGLLEQQLSEIIKNGISHGNKGDPAKILKVWYDFRKRARFIVLDEGEGFTNLDEWNEFFRRRQIALFERNFDLLLELARYRGPTSAEEDGGNSLIAAIEYWNGGMFYSRKRNKVGVVRWFPNGSEMDSFQTP